MKNNTLTIIKKEFARFFGDKRMVISVILVPGLMIYLLYSLMGMMMSKQLVTADDYIGTAYVQNMPEELSPMFEALPLNWQEVSDSEVADIKDSLAAKESDLLLIFPENFMSDMNAYDSATSNVAPNISVYHNSSRSESSTVYSMVMSLLDTYETTLTNRFDVNAGTVKYDLASEKDATGQLFSMMLPLLLMIFLFSGCLSVAPESIAGEKERGTIATLLVTPMKRSSLALGKIISLSCIALLAGLSSFIGTMLSLPNMMGGAMELDTSYYSVTDYALLLGVILSTILVLISLISCVSAYAKSIKEASSLCAPLNILTMVVSLVPSMSGDELKKLGMFFIPIYNSVLCMTDIFSFEANITGVLITIGMNIVYACVLTFILTRIFNSENAMFSK